jgi:23S rRNA (guanosine2251-2'-O)-methyltransferase
MAKSKPRKKPIHSSSRPPSGHARHGRSRDQGAGRPRSGKGRDGGEAGLWIHGRHPVLAALANPERRCHRLLVAKEDAASLTPAVDARLAARGGTLRPEIVERREIAALLDDEAVHQGLALRADPLPSLSLEAFLERPEDDTAPVCVGTTIVALDQVTDPRNVGAIFRSAAAFGARAVLLCTRHAPPETGALVRAASGAVELVPKIEVANLTRALDRLKSDGWWALGLADDAPQELAGSITGERTVLVLGAEGKGLRRLTRETCDVLVRLPTDPEMPSLNVSNAAAVALFALGARRPDRT